MKTIGNAGNERRNNILGISSAISASLLFGTAPIFVKLAFAGGSNEFTMTFTRTLFSVPVLFLIAKLMKISLRLSKRQLFTLLFISIAGNYAAITMLYASYAYVGVGPATVLHYISPVIIMLLNILLFKEKLERWKVLSLILAFSGMLTFFARPGEAHLLGAILGIGSAISYTSVYLGVEHTTLNRLHYITLAFYVSLFAGAASLIVGRTTDKLNFHMTPAAWGYSAIFALMVAVGAFALLNHAIVLVGSTTTSVICMLEPITGILVGYFILNETYSLINWIGCILILLGAATISIFSLKSAKRDAKDENAQREREQTRS